MAVRLISSFVGVAVALAVLFLHKTVLFPLAIAGVTAIILFELIRVVKGTQFYLATAGALLYGIITPFIEFYQLGTYLTLIHFLCLMLIFLELIWHSGTFHVEQIAFIIMCTVLVTRSLNYLITLKQMDAHGMLYVVLALCGAWVADSGAYFAGITLGRHKLCPTISPKKTVEGFIGGIITNAVVFVLVCVGYVYFMQDSAQAVEVRYLETALLGVVCAVISVLGDLSASVIKRQKHLKDYGTIMPGHGGLMDRFDSVLFVVPTLYVFLTQFSIFK